MLISIKGLCDKYQLKPTGVLHIGAHEGQEASEYVKCGMNTMHFVEAIPEVYEKLKKHISQYPGAKAYNVCIGANNGDVVEFKITSNQGQSSSYLELGTHKEVHPDVKVVKTTKMHTWRIDHLFKASDLSGVDFLNIDLQGAELIALKSMGDLLDQFNYAYLEVNVNELYIGCPLLNDIDEFMKAKGFKRMELHMTNFGWGDAFYIKHHELH